MQLGRQSTLIDNERCRTDPAKAQQSSQKIKHQGYAKFDPSSQSHFDTVLVITVLNQFSLRSLHAMCSPLSLVLSGNNMTITLAPELKHLSICGIGPLQKLSHWNVLPIRHLILTGPLARLKFENFRLQDGREWLYIVERMRFSMLQIISLRMSSRS